jgi:hypothetical protein
LDTEASMASAIVTLGWVAFVVVVIFWLITDERR